MLKEACIQGGNSVYGSYDGMSNTCVVSPSTVNNPTWNVKEIQSIQSYFERYYNGRFVYCKGVSYFTADGYYMRAEGQNATVCDSKDDPSYCCYVEAGTYRSYCRSFISEV